MRRHRPDREGLPFLRLLPNLITMLGLFVGLTSIRFVLAERFEIAAVLIILVALIDGLDGLLARRLQASSDFGAELDSLADFLNFGVAPALLIFEYTLKGVSGLGWTFVLVYASCCCLRLARFNVARGAPPETGGSHRHHFVGVPAPAGALLALLPVFLSFAGFVDTSSAALPAALCLGLVGLAMVSRLPTFSPKSVFVPRERVVWVLIAAAVATGLMLTRFWLSMILIDLIYVGSLVHSMIRTWRNRRRGAGALRNPMTGPDG